MAGEARVGSGILLGDCNRWEIDLLAYDAVPSVLINNS
jgi:hypothetical protein